MTLRNYKQILRVRFFHLSPACSYSTEKSLEPIVLVSGCFQKIAKGHSKNLAFLFVNGQFFLRKIFQNFTALKFSLTVFT